MGLEGRPFEVCAVLSRERTVDAVCALKVVPKGTFHHGRIFGLDLRGWFADRLGKKCFEGTRAFGGRDVGVLGGSLRLWFLTGLHRGSQCSKSAYKGNF